MCRLIIKYLSKTSTSSLELDQVSQENNFLYEAEKEKNSN